MDQDRNKSATALRWRAWIDWAGNGSWDSDGPDVSADVLGLRWQWGRCGLPVPEFAPPAELELTLRNHDHRYTPGNTIGPLSGNVQPARRVWLRASRIQDDLPRAARRLLTLMVEWRSAADGGKSRRWPATAFPCRTGWPWGRAAAGRRRMRWHCWIPATPLATLTARYRRGSNGLGGFALRCAARDDCLRLRFASDATILERVSGRTATQLSDGAPLDVEQWYDLEIEQTAGSVRVHAIALGQPGATRREILAATGITGAPESGRHGLWHGFRNTQDRWDDFGVGRSLFRGHITGIDPDYDAGVCRVTAADVMQRLDAVPLHRALAGGLMRSGNVAASILGWAGLLPGDYDLDDGRMLLTGGPRSVWDVSAGRALRRLQREEHGLIYADGLGRVRLEAAARRADLRGHPNPTSLARFSIGDTAAALGSYATALRRDDGADGVEDAVTFRYRRSSDAGRQQVWTLNEALEIPADGEQVLLAATDAWDVIDGIAAPVADTDYTATDDAAGAGNDVTDDITVAILSEAQSGIAGKGHALRIRNSGQNTAYLQSLDLYANHCWRAQSSSAVRAEAAAGSLQLKTERGRVIHCRYADNYAAAESAGQARLAERGTQRPHLEVELPLLIAANLPAVVQGSLSDVVEVQAPTQGIAGAWLLEGMEVSVSGGGDGKARWWLTAV